MLVRLYLGDCKFDLAGPDTLPLGAANSTTAGFGFRRQPGPHGCTPLGEDEDQLVSFVSGGLQLGQQTDRQIHLLHEFAPKGCFISFLDDDAEFRVYLLIGARPPCRSLVRRNTRC